MQERILKRAVEHAAKSGATAARVAVWRLGSKPRTGAHHSFGGAMQPTAHCSALSAMTSSAAAGIAAFAYGSPVSMICWLRLRPRLFRQLQGNGMSSRHPVDSPHVKASQLRPARPGSFYTACSTCSAPNPPLLCIRYFPLPYLHWSAASVSPSSQSFTPPTKPAGRTSVEVGNQLNHSVADCWTAMQPCAQPLPCHRVLQVFNLVIHPPLLSRRRRSCGLLPAAAASCCKDRRAGQPPRCDALPVARKWGQGLTKLHAAGMPLCPCLRCQCSRFQSTGGQHLATCRHQVGRSASTLRCKAKRVLSQQRRRTALWAWRSKHGRCCAVGYVGSSASPAATCLSTPG